MKIYTRKEFLNLPSGVFFAKGIKWAIDGFCIKHETIFGNNGEPIDFFYQNIIDIESRSSEELFERYEMMLEKGISSPINESVSRDGCFDDDEIFLVFEPSDLTKIHSWIEDQL